MNLDIKDHLYIVGGAGAGFGRATALALASEGAKVIAVARTEEKLKALQKEAGANVEILCADIMSESTIDQLRVLIGTRMLKGMLVNAGGPPAKTSMETSISDWDEAYQRILRWKVVFTKAFIDPMIKSGYGRILYVESSSVKQPVENLVLSTSLRLAVLGFVKTFSQEVAATGVCLNILAPGSHDTDAVERLFKKKSEQTHLSIEEVRAAALKQIPVGRLGNPAEFASLACWLLSPHAGYITGQTISVDGGLVKSVFG